MIIKLNSPKGISFGFTSDKFGPKSYLKEQGRYIVVCAIESNQKGGFKGMIKNILTLGYGVKVPNPLPKMTRILKRNGYKEIVEHGHDFGGSEVWVFEPLRANEGLVTSGSGKRIQTTLKAPDGAFVGGRINIEIGREQVQRIVKDSSEDGQLVLSSNIYIPSGRFCRFNITLRG